MMRTKSSKHLSKTPAKLSFSNFMFFDWKHVIKQIFTVILHSNTAAAMYGYKGIKWYEN